MCQNTKLRHIFLLSQKKDETSEEFHSVKKTTKIE